jgi:NAD(P)-dependent dehydrogenase (short-subunit alcohol dehydrogenase family)
MQPLNVSLCCAHALLATNPHPQEMHNHDLLALPVCCVCTCSINTEVLASVVADKAAMERVLSRTPLGRVGEPSEIGSVTAFLASQDSSYITGQIMYVDGGRMALNYTVPVPQK